MRQKIASLLVIAALLFSQVPFTLAQTLGTGTPSTETAPVQETVTPPADTTPPVISGVASPSAGLSDATIIWSTEEAAVSNLEYGTTESYGSSAALPATALLAHSATLTGLIPGTLYHYQ